jgi:hypothetical protein
MSAACVREKAYVLVDPAGPPSLAHSKATVYSDSQLTWFVHPERILLGVWPSAARHTSMA